MRIMFWSPLFWPYLGGMELFAMRLLPELRDRGHELIVVTSHYNLELPDLDTYRGIPVYRLPFRPALANNDLRRLILAKQRLAEIKYMFKPELVHINLPDPSVFFYLQTKQVWPCITLLTIHGHLGEHCALASGTILNHALRGADWITVISRILLNDLQNMTPEVAKRTSLIYNAVPEMPEPPVSLSGNSQCIVCVGRFIFQKGFDLAVAALPRIQQEFPDARLVLVGDGPGLPHLRNHATELGIAGAVAFTGWLNSRQLSELFESSAMVLVPSRHHEGFGLVALEASMHSRPVVVTNVGALPEVVENMKTGLVVQAENSHALADAARCLLRDPDLAAQFGAAGRARAREQFDFNRHVEQYDFLYQQLLS